ncbi:integration host factor subunit alpha [Candidatus Kinetoplastibacterium blastocrithidii TCC012E]|uniref:Integration host factor subunit alpha n=1 Tax=Candidatus Kinetoplastidibacterium blastocrithidiae TCC012E TaxID=1208922 RepID=M1LBA6_9PROT|nr:integration host factor subunit alpha [Candidatus Kinetoplastibacterium blastocrithidii]AFZ83607.1 integration host factor subunit alpha [Candidatus Kinetoplastibacterium blastocrithidii (ex Strigomonas culicis)]AGF49728.1 integration host factor subunit alpha [Candidatus Kinetoplastibacterium blastocrithidii TCC012E]
MLKSNTLTKAELVILLFERTGLTKRDSRFIVECFFDEIANFLYEGHNFKLSGFGNFHLLDKMQRPGRNPKTGKAFNVSARRVVSFHASNKLKKKINNRNGL